MPYLESFNAEKGYDRVKVTGVHIEPIGAYSQKFKQVDELKEGAQVASLPRVLPDVDLAVINTNYPLEADLVPTKDALFIEDKDSSYVNILVSRPDNQNAEALQKLAAALNAPEVKQFIEDKYAGAVVPAF